MINVIPNIIGNKNSGTIYWTSSVVVTGLRDSEPQRENNATILMKCANLEQGVQNKAF